jgi:hypothetical protein
MTEPPPPPDDQLVSDHLDGVAPDPAAVPGTEAGRDRLARFADARAQVAAEVPVPAGARDAAVAAALEVFDTEVSPSAAGAVSLPDGPDRPRPPASREDVGLAGPAAPGGPAGLPGDELAVRRRRRWRTAPVLGAAASVLLVVGLIAGVRREQQAQDQMTSAGAPAAGSADRAGPSPPLQAPALSGPMPASGGAAQADANARAGAPVSAAPAGPDLGEVSDAASFRRAVAAALPRLLGATTTAAARVDPSVPAAESLGPTCEAALRAAHPELGAVAVRSAAHRDGTTLPMLAFLVPAPSPAPPQAPTVRAFLIDPASCRAVFDETV